MHGETVKFTMAFCTLLHAKYSITPSSAKWFKQ